MCKVNSLNKVIFVEKYAKKTETNVSCKLTGKLTVLFAAYSPVAMMLNISYFSHFDHLSQIVQEKLIFENSPTSHPLVVQAITLRRSSRRPSRWWCCRTSPCRCQSHRWRNQPLKREDRFIFWRKSWTDDFDLELKLWQTPFKTGQIFFQRERQPHLEENKIALKFLSSEVLKFFSSQVLKFSSFLSQVLKIPLNENWSLFCFRNDLWNCPRQSSM